MLVKCEEPIDELTVQVWLLYFQPNFKYCTLFVRRTELRTDGWTQTKGETEELTIQLLNAQGGPDDPITKCPQRNFQAGGIKIAFSNFVDVGAKYFTLTSYLLSLAARTHFMGK